MPEHSNPDKFTSQYIEVIKSQCMGCVYHSDKAVLYCLAFPDGKGIPREIFLNEVMHDKPYKGDHGLQFKAKLESLGEANAGK